MRIVDAHHHLWDPRAVDYALLRPGGPLGALARPFEAGAFDEVARRHGVSGAIAVEAASAGADPDAETAWLMGQVARSAVTTGMVAWAPIEEPRIGAYLDALLERARVAGVHVVGVRRSFESVPVGFVLQPGVTEGIRAVAARGLIVDLVLFGDRLGEVVELVERLPEAAFVLDHLGKPAFREDELERWRGQIALLGRRQNVVAKVSGLATESDTDDWEDRLEPVVRQAATTFGWERLMFASDWPICDLAGGYGRWLDFLDGMCRTASATEREAFFGTTAERVYGAT